MRASLKKGSCTPGEALKYFRCAFPELLSDDPGGDASAAWWDSIIRSKPKEGFADEGRSAELTSDEVAEYRSSVEPIEADDEIGAPEELALDLTVIVGGVEEARKHLADLRSRRLSLEEIRHYLDETWPVTTDKALTFTGPTKEQVAMNFVLECGGHEQAAVHLESWIANGNGG